MCSLFLILNIEQKEGFAVVELYRPVDHINMIIFCSGIP